MSATRSPDEPCILESAHRLLGEAACEAIWRAFGGCRVYVPQRVRDDSPLARVVGVEAVRLLAAEIGGTIHDVPTFWEQGFRGRRERVLRGTLAGLPEYVLSRQCGCTERHIRRIKRELRDAGELPPSKHERLAASKGNC